MIYYWGAGRINLDTLFPIDKIQEVKEINPKLFNFCFKHCLISFADVSPVLIQKGRKK